MYKFSQKCTKGLKNVQNLDARLLWFLRQKRAYFAIFGTQLRVYCDFPKSERITGSMMENLITKWFSNIWNSQYITEERKIFFYLPVPPNFNLRWFECLDIPATIVTKERSNFLSLLYLPIFTSDDLNVQNSGNNGAELACFEPISLVFFFLMKHNVQLQKFTSSVQNLYISVK